ncbi:MAG: formylmethanofuran--tetrahydromethanopterin N-formyltransferase [Candidatus Hydrothermarchaeaceae archaeon]
MDMEIVEDTFAEAFISSYSRVLITAIDKGWAEIAARAATGYGTSMIDCSAETGIEGPSPSSTPDSREGVVIQIWTSKKKMKAELLGRLGQCVLTSPTAAAWNQCKSEERLDVGRAMGFFGDGYQEERVVHGRNVVAIPIMMGEFLIERDFGVAEGVAGGNFFILAKNQAAAFNAAEKAVKAIKRIDGVIAPFPGGICAAGSKIGSRYRFLNASTNVEYCPVISDKVVNSKVKDIGGVAEIVLDGIDEQRVRIAMRAGIQGASSIEGVIRITAGNYGGKLGDVKIYLRELF